MVFLKKSSHRDTRWHTPALPADTRRCSSCSAQQCNLERAFVLASCEHYLCLLFYVNIQIFAVTFYSYCYFQIYKKSAVCPTNTFTNTSTFSITTKLTIADRSIDWLCSGRTGEAASSWRPERRSTAAATCRGWRVGCGGGRGRGARIGGGGGGGEGKDGGVVGGGGGRRAVAALSSTHARS